MVHYSRGALICLPLCFICCVVASGSGARTGHKAGCFGPERKFDVVIPRKVAENGDFISHVIPHTYKRSVIRQKKKAKSPPNKLFYIVPFDGVEHHVELQPTENLVSPGVVVESQGGADDRWQNRDIRKFNDTQCQYTGLIRGDKYSKVAISTCDGLSGYIRTKRHYFLIQPGRGHDPYSGKQHPHIVEPHRLEQPVDTNCHTSGDVANIIARRALRRGAEANKCNTAAELYVETLVVVDHSMLTYHKNIDVENYILTVFNMAHDLYHDASLGTNIDLAIVRLVRLEQEDHEMNMAVNKDATKTLDYFRQWQSKINPAEDSHPNHHDVAVLLTRIDICSTDNSCGLLGASKIGGMCDPHNQAAICEDNGLRLGFIIAHEIAHTLAILHDTLKESGCNSTLPGNLTTVMSETVTIRTAEWSPCSGKFLQLFIDSGLGKCLNDPPTDHSFAPVDVLPGVMYDADFQCRELLGPNAALCMTGLDCGNLICYVEDKGCIETHQGVAPGTKCGEKKWCYHGRCVEVGERLCAIDGGWGAWSEWSQCSRTCGSGVSTQERHCDNPLPAHGGKYCSGDHKKHKICSTEPCDVNQPSFRDVQCAEFNSWVYPEDGKVHMWSSYPMHDENPCVLFCVNDLGDIASLRPRVVDGTSCQHGMRDICINGLCKEIPCDLDLESDTVEDVCGVCKGDSTSCTLIDGEVKVSCCGHIKEEEILVIPENSINIKIEEMLPTESRVQIRSKDGGNVFVIGNVLGTFNVPGSSAWVGNIRTRQEAISIPGPICDAISIWIVVIENVTITYSYGVPAKTNRTPEFFWDFLTWSRCSAECGPGIEESTPSCVEKMGGLVDKCYCSNLLMPKVQLRPCEIAPCVTRWFIGDWQPCNKCPKGKRSRIVKCVRPTGEGEGEVIFISDSECVGPKPKTSEACTCVVKGETKTDKYHKGKRSNRRSTFNTGRAIGAEIPLESTSASAETNAVSIGDSSIAEKLDETSIAPLSTDIPTVAPMDETSAETSLTGRADEMSSVTPMVGNAEETSAETPAAKLDEVGVTAAGAGGETPLAGKLDETSTESPAGKLDESGVSVQVAEPNALSTGMDMSRATVDLSAGTGSSETECVTTACETQGTFASTLPPIFNEEECEETTLTPRVESTSTECLTATTPPCVNPPKVNTSEPELNATQICEKLADLMGKTILDKEDVKNVSLTVHTELENGERPEGVPPPKCDDGNPTFNVEGKDAMKFLNEMQKDFENNKTQI